MSKTFTLATAVALAVGGLYAQNANAGTVQVTNLANATASCQSSLPVFDVNIRKSPVAVTNKGDSNSFVTCSFETETFTGDYETTPILDVDMYLINHSGADVDMTCTLVDGYETGADFYTQTVTIPGTGEQTDIDFFYSDWTEAGFLGPVSINCLVPPNVGLNDHYVAYLVTTPDPAPPAAR